LAEKDGKPLTGVTGAEEGSILRLSMDCKATVKIGDYSRGGQTRGNTPAADHDMGCQEKYVPLGILEEDRGQLHLTFGHSFKTSDFIVDSLQDWWQALPAEQQAEISHLQLKVDNGPESSGVRTQFLKRMVAFADDTGKTIQLLYYPPYHSKYNPIERCWGILEQHWNGTLLVDTETMLEWAKSMTWKGIRPIVKLSRKVYEKGISLSKKAMQEIETRLERNPLLPKWDILIRPV
jgi:transposase